MHEFKRTNKVTGVYWLKNPLQNLRVKVKLKPKDSIMTLPKFEDYTNESFGANAENFETVKEYSFSWQEKIFSLWQLQRYSDVHNCTSENELRYHNMLENLEHEPAKLFTYIHEDYYLPLPESNGTLQNNNVNLNACLARLNLNCNRRALNADTSSMGHLFRSEENIDSIDQKWKAMHIVFDNSEYDSDSHLIFKQEAVLISLFHNVNDNYLLVSPDGNSLDMNPYCVETRTGVTLDYEYAVDIQFQDENEYAEELVMLLKKLGKKWEKKHKHLVNFSMPPLGKKLHYVTLEILTASDFDMDDLYIEFDVKLPQGVECKDTLHGRTHISKAMRSEEAESVRWNYGHLVELTIETSDESGVECKDTLDGRTHISKAMRSEEEESVRWNYGHLVELTIETSDESEPVSLQLFFEAISTDWWGRHRTEGYSYLPLTLEPGSHSKLLSCSRPEEMDRVEAESRRFFVGGCHLIKNLEVLANPHMQNANFVYTTTGSIELRWNVLSHSPIPGYVERKEIAPGTSASALLRGAEAVLRQYKRARARLAAATKDLGGRGDGFDDD